MTTKDHEELLDELFTIGNMTDEQFRAVKKLRAENQRWHQRVAEVEEVNRRQSDTIIDLRAENERLRAALERIGEAAEQMAMRQRAVDLWWFGEQAWLALNPKERCAGERPPGRDNCG